MVSRRDDAAAQKRRQVFIGAGIPPRAAPCAGCGRELVIGNPIWTHALDAEALCFCSERCYFDHWLPPEPAAPPEQRLPEQEPRAHARTTDPETSHEAARSVTAFRPRWVAILDCFRAHGPMTDEELAVRYEARGATVPEQSPSGLRTRRSELVALGALAPVGQSKTEAGRSCIVWGIPAKEGS